MKPSNKVIVLFIDAFSSNYLKSELCPAIYKLSKEYHCFDIDPMFAFQGIGATLFTGTWPNTTQIWAEYVQGNDKFLCECPFLQKVLKVIDFIPNDRINWDVRYVLFKLFGKTYIGTPNAIPADFLKFFKTCLQKGYNEENCISNSIKTLFDVTRENGISYNFIHSPTQFEHQTIDKLIKTINNQTISDLTILHIGSLDLIGHNYGPNTEEIEQGIKKIDNEISNIIHAIKESASDIQLIIFSDHGMSPIHEYLNISEIVNKLPLSAGDDYLMFLDSTMARFWFHNSHAKNEIIKALSKYRQGHILSSSECAKYHIEKLNRDHGEMIYTVNDGVAIFPDYFRRFNPPKGMHGYADPNDNPIMILSSEITKIPNLVLDPTKPLEMIDIMPIILTLLNCPIPYNCESKLMR